MEKFLNILNKVKDKTSAKRINRASSSETISRDQDLPPSEKISPPQRQEKESPAAKTPNKLREDWKNLIAELTTTDIRFYFLKGDYLAKINQMYYDYSLDLEEIGISQRKFIDFIRESFERIKQVQKKLPLEPMNPKFYDYVDKCVQELMVGLRQKFKK